MFSLILALLSLLTGAAWVYDRRCRLPKRRNTLSERLKIEPELDPKERRRILEPDGFIGQIGSLFFIVLFVFIFRAYCIEPFRIPSGSMEPTLEPGDFIAVTKWSYGLRNPVTNAVWLPTGKPQRGDVVVFKYPEEPSVDYIKRVVGLPGDVVIYRDKQLYVLPAGSPEGREAEYMSQTERERRMVQSRGAVEQYIVYDEDLSGYVHRIMINPHSPQIERFYFRQSGAGEFIWRVPEDHYFTLGDNRDNSKDSRFWGFVPYENLVGKAVGIWLSLELDRPQGGMLPGWLPSDIRFSRIGGIK